MGNIVDMPPPRRPSLAQVDKEAEAQAAGDEAADEVRNGEEIDLDDAQSRAEAIRGALSTLDIISVTGPEFWAICAPATRPLYLAWARKALATLEGIVAEGEKIERGE